MQFRAFKFLASLVPLTPCPSDLVEEVERVARGNPGPGSREVLDVGCCGGALGAHLIQRGFQVTGVDWDAYYLSKARERGYARVIEADLTRPLSQIQDGSFPIVMASEVLEHIPAGALEALLSELHRVCRGTLVVTAPNRDHLLCKAVDFFFFERGWLDLFHMGRHCQQFSPAGLKALLEKAGFSVERSTLRLGGSNIMLTARKR